MTSSQSRLPSSHSIISGEPESDFDAGSSSGEELECQRNCDYSCGDECPGRGSLYLGEEDDDEQGESPLEEMAMNSKLLLFALLPMLGRQLGSVLARRCKPHQYGMLTNLF